MVHGGMVTKCVVDFFLTDDHSIFLGLDGCTYNLDVESNKNQALRNTGEVFSTTIRLHLSFTGFLESST